MRAELWLRLRSSPTLRHMAENKLLGPLLSGMSRLLQPEASRRPLRIRSGLAEGIVLELDPRWDVKVWEGAFEPQVQRVLDANLTSGTVFYDVGAGIGLYSLVAARRGAKVFAFEPEPRNAELTVRHAQSNQLDGRILLVPRAVFSSTGEIWLEPADCSRGHGNGRVGRAIERRDALIRVPSVTLDDYVCEAPPPTFIKMDVEGVESEVLKGAQAVFREHRPVVLCEVHDPVNAAFVMPWLATRGYHCEWLEPGPEFPRHLYAVAGARE